jgi:hypothetical protein
MKIIERESFASIVLAALLSTQAIQSFGQTNLSFTSASVTDESAIHLSWNSVSNEVYQIEEADALNTNADGSTAWNLLYDNYPSQGTNTFWLDTGNYNLNPQILHPKYMPMRFYRIVDLGPDTTSDEPAVTILSPTNGSAATGELTVTVFSVTDQPVLSGTTLYVDGQEMQMPDSTTNYTDITGVTNYEIDTYNLNTCEWGNETHVLFATVEAQSAYGDAVGSGSILTGHGVSAFVPILFSNLVTRISFSQPSFDPSSGQTQQVSAVFAANSDWTLNITDINSNIVQSATGSGMSMLYNWDGTSGGTNLPNGIYYYYISAATNGASSDVETGGSGGGSPPTPDFSMIAPRELWAVAPDSETVVPLSLYPPGFNTNGFTIFSASQSELAALTASSRARPTVAADTSGGGGFTPDASGGGSSAASQSAPAAPQRPPANPVRGLAGSFGICYDTYQGNGSSGYTLAPLDNGLHVGLDISMNNNSAGASLHYAPLPQYKEEANNFVSQMQHWGWKNTLLKVDKTLNFSDLTGSGSALNSNNLAVFMAHGAFGTGNNGIDYAANQCKQMYYPVTSGTSAQYLRLSQMNLGGSGTNGLKWAALLACNSLQHNNWASMQTAGIKPYNGNLHLLCGVDTVNYTSRLLLWYWAKFMNYGTSTNAGAYSPLTIRNAWYSAAHWAYAGGHYANNISFVVAGDTACATDTVATNSAPGGTWFIDTPVQVWP